MGKECRVEDCGKAARKNDSLCSMHRARWSRNKTFNYVGHKLVDVDKSIMSRIVTAAGPDDCWSWTGYHANGYPVLRNRTLGNVKVHRRVYEKYVGPLVDGLVIDHACGNRGCLNPSHLRQISNQKNVENFTTEVRSHNSSGYRGVHFHKASGLWIGEVTAGGRKIVTYHKTVEEAAEAARQLRLKHHTHNELDRKTG